MQKVAQQAGSGKIGVSFWEEAQDLTQYFRFGIIRQIQGPKKVLKKSALLKGTASAVPQLLSSQCGFSR
jgi:hypothetical protein